MIVKSCSLYVTDMKYVNDKTVESCKTEMTRINSTYVRYTYIKQILSYTDNYVRN